MDSEAWLRLMLWRFLLPALIFALSKGVYGLRMISLNMPTHVLTGSRIILECLYEKETEDVYSVKWYKDSEEFFRYMPNDTPPMQIFNHPGIRVNQNESNMKTVCLENVDLFSAGSYRCEVSAEAPTFKTVDETHEMAVYDVPDGGPQITGIRPKYNLDDTVHANCTAIRSKPAAILQWYINGDKAPSDKLHKYPTIMDDETLETAILGLEFRVEEHHFHNGDMRLNCTATISYAYKETAFVQSLLSPPVSAPVLESKGTSSQVKGVQTGGASSSESLGYASVILFAKLVEMLLLR